MPPMTLKEFASKGGKARAKTLGPKKVAAILAKARRAKKHYKSLRDKG